MLRSASSTTALRRWRWRPGGPSPIPTWASLHLHHQHSHSDGRFRSATGFRAALLLQQRFVSGQATEKGRPRSDGHHGPSNPKLRRKGSIRVGPPPPGAESLQQATPERRGLLAAFVRAIGLERRPAPKRRDAETTLQTTASESSDPMQATSNTSHEPLPSSEDAVMPPQRTPSKHSAAQMQATSYTTPKASVPPKGKARKSRNAASKSKPSSPEAQQANAPSQAPLAPRDSKSPTRQRHDPAQESPKPEPPKPSEPDSLAGSGTPIPTAHSEANPDATKTSPDQLSQAPTEQTPTPSRPHRLLDLSPPEHNRRLQGTIYKSDKIRALPQWRETSEVVEAARRFAARVQYRLFQGAKSRQEVLAIQHEKTGNHYLVPEPSPIETIAPVNIELAAAKRAAQQARARTELLEKALSVRTDTSWRFLTKWFMPEDEKLSELEALLSECRVTEGTCEQLVKKLALEVEDSNVVTEAKTLWGPRACLENQPPLPQSVYKDFAQNGLDLIALADEPFSWLSRPKRLISKRATDMMLGSSRPLVHERVWLPMWVIDASFQMPISNASQEKRRPDEKDGRIIVRRAYLPGHNNPYLRSLRLDIPEHGLVRSYQKLADIDEFQDFFTDIRKDPGLDAKRASERAAALWDRLSSSDDDDHDITSDHSSDRGATRIPFTVSPLTAVRAFQSSVSHVDITTPGIDLGRLGDERKYLNEGHEWLHWYSEYEDLQQYVDKEVSIAPCRMRIHTSGLKTNILAMHPVLLPMHVMRIPGLDLNNRPQETLVVQGGWDSAEPTVAMFPQGSLPSRWHYESEVSQWQRSLDDWQQAGDDLPSMNPPMETGSSLGSTLMFCHPNFPLTFGNGIPDFLALEKKFLGKVGSENWRRAREEIPEASEKKVEELKDKYDTMEEPMLDQRGDSRRRWHDVYAVYLSNTLAHRLEQFKGLGGVDESSERGAMEVGLEEEAERPGGTVAATQSSSPVLPRRRSSLVRVGQNEKSTTTTTTTTKTDIGTAVGNAGSSLTGHHKDNTTSRNTSTRQESVQKAADEKQRARKESARKEAAQRKKAAQEDAAEQRAAGVTKWWSDLEELELWEAEVRLGVADIRKEAIAAAKEDYRSKVFSRFDAVQKAGKAMMNNLAASAAEEIKPYRDRVREARDVLAKYKSQVEANRQQRAEALASVGASEEEQSRLAKEAASLHQLQQSGGRVSSSLASSTVAMFRNMRQESGKGGQAAAFQAVLAAAKSERQAFNDRKDKSEDDRIAALEKKVKAAEDLLSEAERSSRLYEANEWIEKWETRTFAVDKKQQASVVSRMLESDETLRLYGDTVDFGDSAISDFSPEETEANQRYLLALQRFDEERQFFTGVLDVPTKYGKTVMTNGVRYDPHIWYQEKKKELDEEMPRWLRQQNEAYWEEKLHGTPEAE